MSPSSDGAEGVRYFPAELVREQIAACLTAWGMSPQHVATTADVMIDADKCGIDTHGISLLVTYADRHRTNRLTVDAKVEVVNVTPVSALVDGGGGLGYVPSVMATEICIAKAKENGVAAVAVRNSNHFGATGYYTRMMARAGLVGLATTNGSGGRAAPALGKEAKLSTNPLAFAAPTSRNPIFHLDMATTTVAAGKLRVRANEGLQIPVGWANDENGEPLTDPSLYDLGSPFTLTPLGGTIDGANFKGYGLSAMVEILSAGLSGARLVTTQGVGEPTPGTMNMGHFFLAINPTLFRAEGEFEATTDTLIDHLHQTAPIDPAHPVMVAGEDQDNMRLQLAESGVPVAPGFLAKLRDITDESGAKYLLD
jgi:LDH2 family malate/lactate/ureidoglycolate dehydrogenase